MNLRSQDKVIYYSNLQDGMFWNYLSRSWKTDKVDKNEISLQEKITGDRGISQGAHFLTSLYLV